MRSSDSSVDTDESDHSIIEEKQIDELAPIPTLKELTVRAAIVDSAVRMILEIYRLLTILSTPWILKQAMSSCAEWKKDRSDAG